MFPDTARSIEASAFAPRLLARVASAVAGAARDVSGRWCSRRRAVSLTCLNDRTLADLGYHRSSITPAILAYPAAGRGDGKVSQLLAACRERP
jgi:uncharacterized protein YjiS (DUF1127 family)